MAVEIPVVEAAAVINDTRLLLNEKPIPAEGSASVPFNWIHYSSMNKSDLTEFNKLVSSRSGSETTGQPCVAQSAPDNLSNFKSFSARLWAVSGDAFLPCEQAVPQLPPGHYIIDVDPSRGIFFRKHDFSIDNLLHLPDSASEKVIKQIEKFWTLENHFREYGFLWKRGILLWGPPGSGKTSTVQLITADIIKRGGIALSIYNPSLSAAGLHIMRKIEPKRPIVAILEDVDAIVSRFGEAELLALLDGEQQIDNVVYLATTNYPQKLDYRIVNRPSRFDVIEKIGMPNAAAREVYLQAKSKLLSKNSKTLKKWIEDTEGFSVAHLKELLIAVEVFQSEYEESLERLRIMMECGSNSDDDHRKPMGFKV